MPDTTLHKAETWRFLPVIYIKVIIVFFFALNALHITATFKKTICVNRGHFQINIFRDAFNCSFSKMFIVIIQDHFA